MIDQFRQRLVSRGLGRPADRIIALARPAVRLATQRVGQDLAPGSSKVGGFPDTGSDWEWPSWKGQRLSFLAQINLADLHVFSFCDVLPKEGLLQFFYDVEQRTWGFDPNDFGSWVVRWEPKIPDRRTTEESKPFPVCSVTTTAVLTLPSWDSQAIVELKLTAQERDQYFDLVNELETIGSSILPAHQILGFPGTIQAEMEEECQLVSNGLYCGDASGYNDPRAAALKCDAGQWRLLFQLDSDKNSEMMWGDIGRLYFWITETALAEREFRKCWMILQCA